MKNPVIAFLIGAVVAGLTTWLVVSMTAPTQSGSLDRTSRAADALPDLDRPASPAGDDVEPAELRGAPDVPRRLDTLREENRALQAKVVALKAEVERLVPKPLDPSAFRFGVPAQAPSFDKAEWPKLGTRMVNLSGELRKLRDTVVASREPTAADIAAIHEQNTPLARFAGAFGADTGDLRPNSAFTHPAVIANLIRASLLNAEDPLTHEQEVALKTLGDAWLSEWRRLEASFPEDGLALQRLVEEVDQKLRFLDAVKNVLTMAQRDHLWSKETEGRRKLDLLSPALVYILVQPLKVSSPQEMQTALVEALLQRAGAKDVDPAEYEWVGREWMEDLPVGVAQSVSTTSVDLHFAPIDRLQAEARAQVAAAERILAMGKLTSEQAAALRASELLIYPFILAGEN